MAASGSPASTLVPPPAPAGALGAPPHPVLRRLARTIERLVGAEVRAGEWRLVLLCFANLFLLLTAYYVLKVIREPLILLGSGEVRRSYARGVQAVLLAGLVPLYGILANRVEPARLVKWIMGIFAINLTLFYLAGRAGFSLGFVFFVWLGIFSTLAVAQFWSLANDFLTEDEGHRLFPLVAAGGTTGGILGAQLAARTIGLLGPHGLMLVAAAILAGCVALSHLTHLAGRRHRLRLPASRQHPPDTRGGFQLVLQDRYLLLIGLMVVIINTINTTGDFILAQIVNARARAVTAHLADGAHARQLYIGAFYGDFQTYVSVFTALVQITVVARIFKSIGVARALMVLPLFALTGYGISALVPGLTLIAAVKVMENSADYSLQNTVQQALFLRTSRDAKYKAKAAIDTVSVRLGDLASMVLVFVGVQLGLTALGYSLANVMAGVVWLALAVAISRRHRLAVAPYECATVAGVRAPLPVR
jgi:AAA family ATP:ADP antiporter